MRKHVYYGAWNSVLNTVFPISEDYIITPQFPVGHCATEKDTVDFAVLLTVSKNLAMVFFVWRPRYHSISHHGTNGVRPTTRCESGFFRSTRYQNPWSQWRSCNILVPEGYAEFVEVVEVAKNLGQAS